MIKSKRLRAKDWLWDQLDGITLSGGQSVPAHREAIAKALDKVIAYPLPAAAIYALEALVQASYAGGKVDGMSEAVSLAPPAISCHDVSNEK